MKMKRPTSAPRRTLTAVELEMMNVIWQLEPCTVAQVREALPPQRPLAYTSVSTVIRILEQKGFVSSEKAGRGHVYRAAVPKQEIQSASVTELIESLFDGAPSLLVQQLLDSARLSSEELAQIRALLGRKER